MLFCPSCGKELSEPISPFCPNCGRSTSLAPTTLSIPQPTITPPQQAAPPTPQPAVAQPSQFTHVADEKPSMKQETVKHKPKLNMWAGLSIVLIFLIIFQNVGIINFSSLTSGGFRGDSLSPPYTSISNRTVSWHFKISSGDIQVWTMPIDTYKSQIEKAKPTATLTLRYSTGVTFTVRDFTKFVDTWSFSKVIPSLYLKINDDKKFIYEVWYIVSQLSTYNRVEGDDARWSLETLTEGGGDCDDTSVLVASMLKVASANYHVQLVYCDANNPTNPKAMNHMLVYVEAGSYKTYIETTSKTSMNPYTTGITGWYYDA